jgi:antitoxin VapB
MVETRLSKSNKSQPARLPKDVAFSEHVHEVRIIRDGKMRIIAPADCGWDDFFAAPAIGLEPRVEPPVQRRLAKLAVEGPRFEDWEIPN